MAVFQIYFGVISSIHVIKKLNASWGLATQDPQRQTSQHCYSPLFVATKKGRNSIFYYKTVKVFGIIHASEINCLLSIVFDPKQI